MSPSNTSRRPRINHVAMSLPADLLGEQGRAEIIDFYGKVFGWVELPTMTIDRERLVLSAYTYEQFVFLIASDDPMQCPRMDHFGMSVGTLDELEDMYGRARSLAESDERVDLVEQGVDDQEVVKIHNFYVRFLLPMMVEVQFFEWSGETPAAEG